MTLNIWALYFDLNVTSLDLPLTSNKTELEKLVWLWQTPFFFLITNLLQFSFLLGCSSASALLPLVSRCGNVSCQISRGALSSRGRPRLSLSSSLSPTHMGRRGTMNVALCIKSPASFWQSSADTKQTRRRSMTVVWKSNHNVPQWFKNGSKMKVGADVRDQTWLFAGRLFWTF